VDSVVSNQNNIKQGTICIHARSINFDINTRVYFRHFMKIPYYHNEYVVV